MAVESATLFPGATRCGRAALVSELRGLRDVFPAVALDGSTREPVRVVVFPKSS